MQSFQMSPGMGPTQNSSGHGINRMKQEFATLSNFCEVSTSEMPNQSRTFLSPSNSSASPFNTPPTAPVDAVSSVVSMLKDTLERKKLSNKIDKETVEGCPFGFYDAQQVPANTSSDQRPVNHIFEPQGTFQAVSPVHVKDSMTLQMVGGSIDIDIEGFINPGNPIQISAVSQEPSQSESSAAAPVLSSGFEGCDGPTNSGQTTSVCESSRKQIGNGSLEHGFYAKGMHFIFYYF